MCLGLTSSLEFYGCFRCCYRKCFDFSRLVRHGNTFTDKSELKYLMPISCRDQPVTSPTESHPNHVFDTRNLRLPTFLHTFASFTAPPNNYLHTRPALTLFGCPGGFLTLPCTGRGTFWPSKVLVFGTFQSDLRDPKCWHHLLSFYCSSSIHVVKQILNDQFL